MAKTKPANVKPPNLKPRNLKPKGTSARDGKVVVEFKDAKGTPFELALSIFEVSMLVSKMYEARGKALDQPSRVPPEAMLRITNLGFGANDKIELLRIECGTGYHQDFFADQGTDIGRFLKAFSEAAAKTFGSKPAPMFPQSGSNH